MSTLVHTSVQAGIFLPEATLRSEIFAVLATFVALNTIMYAALATAKILPKIYLSDWFRRNNERSETRSIYPDAAIGGPTPRTRAAEPVAAHTDDKPTDSRAISSIGRRRTEPRHRAA